MLKASQAKRPRHTLTDEIISESGTVRVLFAKSGEDDDKNKDDIDGDLAKTPMGRRALAAKKKDGK
jgi:hypothetical protein